MMPMRRKRPFIELALLVSACGALCVSCSKEPEPTRAPDVVARVGGTEITVADMEAEAARRRAIGRAVPDRDTLLDEMIAFEALLERAREAGLSEDPAIQYEFDKLLIARLKDRQLAPRLDDLDVNEETVKAEYEQRIDEFTKPAKTRLAALKISVHPNATAARRGEARARIEEARRRFIENPPAGGRGPAAQGFGAIAIDYTDDQVSRYRGGDLGWLEAGTVLSQWPTEVVETGFSLGKGDVSEIIEDENGFYLVMKADERPARVTPFERVRATLRQGLLAEKRIEVQDLFVTESIEQANVEKWAEALDAVDLPGQSAMSKTAPAETLSPEFPNLEGSSRAE
jgi:parvulin-like peptidyl-prolyl isomerase